MGKTRRIKGEGTIVSKGDKYQVQVSKTLNGRRYRKSATADTKEEAAELLKHLTDEINGPRVGATAATVGDVIDHYVSHMKVREQLGTLRRSTRLWSENMLKHVPDQLRDTRASDVTALVIEQWIKEVGGSASGRRGAFRVLRQAFDLAIRDKLVRSNPFDGVKTPSGDREKEPKFATKEDVDALIAASSEPWKYYWRILADTGMRRGELVALEWRDVNLETQTLIIRDGKTVNARRAIALTDAATEALRSLPQGRGTARVCPYSSRYLARKFTDAAPDGLTPHGLRHGAAQRLLESGVPVNIVSAILGHGSPSTTWKFYSHVVPESMRSAMQNLA